MLKMAAIHNGSVTAVRCSRRVENGVEIVEREVMETVTIDLPAAVRTQLIITEATKAVIAKTRSELAELDNFLRSIFGRSVEANQG